METRGLIDGQKIIYQQHSINLCSFDYQPETTSSLGSGICGLRSVISEILLSAYSVYFNS
jgi:hypothetical protein